MKVLVIDDEADILKQIEKAIASEEGPDGKPYEVLALVDHNEAVQRLGGERFDVVVTDMLMGDDDEEGLKILRKLTDKSPITIVLTAYPRIPICVASMHAGAWDYLEKSPADGSDAYENLLRSMREAYEYRQRHPNAGRTNPDTRWVQEHLGELTKEYGGEVIAVVDQKVVAHDESYGKVAEQIKGLRPVAQPTIVSIPDTEVEAIE